MGNTENIEDIKKGHKEKTKKRNKEIIWKLGNVVYKGIRRNMECRTF